MPEGGVTETVNDAELPTGRVPVLVAADDVPVSRIVLPALIVTTAPSLETALNRRLETELETDTAYVEVLLLNTSGDTVPVIPDGNDTVMLSARQAKKSPSNITFDPGMINLYSLPEPELGTSATGAVLMTLNEPGLRPFVLETVTVISFPWSDVVPVTPPVVEGIAPAALQPVPLAIL